MHLYLILFLLAPAQGIYMRGHPSKRGQACAGLKNHEVYSSVRVYVGSEQVAFDLVADTGSDNCIVKACACEQCPSEWGGCFEGPKDSHSFAMTTVHNKSSKSDDPVSMVMRFGSGDIAATVSSDAVKLGPKEAWMENGLLLMVDHTLELKGKFEGILGLGRPPAEESPIETSNGAELTNLQVPSFLERAQVQRFSLCFNRKADGVLGLDAPKPANPMSSTGHTHWSLNLKGISVGTTSKSSKDAAAAKIEGLCSDQCSAIPDSGTTLTAGPEEDLAKIYDQVCNNWQRCKNTHEELKKEIKKLAKKGIKVEGTATLMSLDPHDFMATVSKIAQQSGTRLREATEAAAQARTATLKWGTLSTGDGHPVRSRTAIAADADNSSSSDQPKTVKWGSLKSTQGILDAATRLGSSIFQEGDPEGELDMEEENSGLEIEPSLTLQLLLEHCSQWMHDANLVEEMPKLSFHVTAADGKTDELKLSPKSYVLSKDLEVEVPSVRNVLGFPLKTTEKGVKTVCSMAFTPTSYMTISDGMIWILGTPLFYEYTAHYDRGTGKEEEITVGFVHQDDEPCGECDAKTNEVRPSQSLIDSSATTGLQQLIYCEPNGV